MERPSLAMPSSRRTPILLLLGGLAVLGLKVVAAQSGSMSDQPVFVPATGPLPAVGLPSGKAPNDGQCVDLNSRCGRWADDGYCNPWYRFEGESVRNTVCRATCGTCDPSGMWRGASGVGRIPALVMHAPLAFAAAAASNNWAACCTCCS